MDKTGKVAICWYDRSADVDNFAIQYFCGESTNGGATCATSSTGAPSFAPSLANDVFINPAYMGDYDDLASDFTGASAGFVGAFQVQGRANAGTPDVVAVSFP